MPITPLHFGPGTVLKVIAGQYISLTVFSFSQITMDIEVIVRLMRGAESLHGFSNTIIGATVLLIPTILVGRPVCTAFLRWWNRNLSPAQAKLMSVNSSITWKAAWIGGILGLYSHWFLDAMMHVAAQPFWPLSSSNLFVTWLSISNVNALCIWSLIIGGALLLTINFWGRVRY